MQPWLAWPALLPDVSYRLTLMICATVCGLCGLVNGTTRGVPKSWVAWVGAFCLVMVVRNAALMRDGGYFEGFHETAFWADGTLTALALLWGCWGVVQLPVTRLRLLRWGGGIMCAVNIAFVLAQWQGWHWPTMTAPHLMTWRSRPQIIGVFGLDRILGAYAVAWLPILLVWSPALALMPLVLVVASAKSTALLGAGFVLGRRYPRIWWMVAPGVLLLAWYWPGGAPLHKIAVRWTVYREVLPAIWQHPWIGHGLHPMAIAKGLADAGATQPWFHSDLLLLAFGYGMPVALAAVWCWWQVVTAPIVTVWQGALQLSLGVIGAMSCVQSVVSDPRIGGVMVVCLAWWVVEQRGTDATSP